jgi:hypothetical protein
MKYSLYYITFTFQQLQAKSYLFQETHFVEYHLLLLTTASLILALSRKTLCRISSIAFDNCKLNFSSFKKLTLYNIIYSFQQLQVIFYFFQETHFVLYHLYLSTTASKILALSRNSLCRISPFAFDNCIGGGDFEGQQRFGQIFLFSSSFFHF